MLRRRLLTQTKFILVAARMLPNSTSTNNRRPSSPPSSPAKQKYISVPSPRASTKRRMSTSSKSSNGPSIPVVSPTKMTETSTRSPQSNPKRRMGSLSQISSGPSSPSDKPTKRDVDSSLSPQAHTKRLLSSNSSRRSPSPPHKPFPDVEHFVRAQAGVGVWGETYEEALRELRRGRKRGHWIWYVFPQVVGLSMSSMGQRFSIHSQTEAQAYLAHPILGARLKEATQAVLDAPTEDIEELFGDSLDAQKFRSSMTLFAIVAQGSDRELYKKVLATYWDGEMDEKTVEIMRYEPSENGSDQEETDEEDDSSGSSVDEGKERGNAKTNDKDGSDGNSADEGERSSNANDENDSNAKSAGKEEDAAKALPCRDQPT